MSFKKLVFVICLGVIAFCALSAVGQQPARDVVDLSVPVGVDLPASWPAGLPPFQIIPYVKHGPGAAATDIVMIDEHTGTQWDAPAHFIPPPGSGLPDAGPTGRLTGDKVPIYQFIGEACVIDATKLLDTTPPGVSPLITKAMVEAWEKANRPLGPGDAVLFRSDYTNKYYKPLPEGRRFVADALDKKAPAWPDPDPECMEYVVKKGVMLLGTDAPSMGPLPDLAAATHVAGAKHGAVWAEMLMNLDKLPTTGAAFVLLAPKHADSSGSECRAFAIPNLDLAKKLIVAAKAKRVVDLSVLLREDLPVWWPGTGVGNHAMPYLGKTLHKHDEPGGPYFARMHVMDMHSGTHVDPPAHFLPPPGFQNSRYDARAREFLADYERRYGARKFSDVTTERVPLDQMMGPARVIDVQHLVGTVDAKSFPMSPKIEPKDVQDYEKRYGDLQPGDVVLFRSGHVDRTFKTFAEGGDACVADPLNGKAEGWPSPSVECIRALAQKGVRCIGTDGPSMGSTNPLNATHTHWAAAGENMVFIEFLTGLGQLPPKGAFFLFAPTKIVGGHGGNGRAVGVLP